MTKRTITAALSIITIAGLIGTVFAEVKELLGAGATFPYPLYSKMFDVYNKETGVKVNYQSIGSGGGIRQLQTKTVDFGASDAFMSDEDLKKAKGTILHVPMCLGAVAITYNLPNVPELKLTPEILSNIFLTKINKWNDPAIAKINPEAKLPNKNIVVVHRSDGSGTTFIFTDYLAKVSSEWKEKVGTGKSVNWPGGVGGKGNEGVSGYVKQIPGSIGYCELAYTIQNNMPQVALKNKKGDFVKPGLESTSKAAETDIPADTRVSLTNTDAPEGYPIAGFTWILIYKEQSYNKRSKEKVETLLNLLSWMIHDGQKYTKPLDYAPLSESAVAKAEKILKSVTYNGKPVLK
jgi:phosphate transport system substrate-binding protein